MSNVYTFCIYILYIHFVIAFGIPPNAMLVGRLIVKAPPRFGDARGWGKGANPSETYQTQWFSRWINVYAFCYNILL